MFLVVSTLSLAMKVLELLYGTGVLKKVSFVSCGVNVEFGKFCYDNV